MHPQRKRNRLIGYDYSQPGVYFVTVCIKDRECLLSTFVGGDAHIAPYTALTAIGRVVEKHIQTIPGIGEYVIMPNHVHMILRVSAKDERDGPMWASAPTKVSVPSMVRSWKTLVSKEIGKSIWQRSYYDHVIRDEYDYLVRQKYIADNPAKWQEDDYYNR